MNNQEINNNLYSVVKKYPKIVSDLIYSFNRVIDNPRFWMDRMKDYIRLLISMRISQVMESNVDLIEDWNTLNIILVKDKPSEDDMKSLRNTLIKLQIISK